MENNTKSTNNITGNEKLKKARTVTIIGLVLNLVLAGVKIAISLIFGSVSQLADGLDSALDLATTILGYIAVRIADKPPDQDHHFGHQKFENFFTLGIAVLLVASSGIIAYQSITRLITHDPLVFTYANMVVSILSIILKGILVWINVRVGKKIDSPILVANGMNFRTDILTSAVVLIGVTVGTLSIGDFSLYWLDPSIAILISIVIILTAINIVKEAAGVLLDRSADPEFIEEMTKIASKQEGVREVGNIRTRFVGSNLYLCDIDILVNPEISIEQGHSIAEKVEEALKNELPVKYCQIHIEPFFDERNNKEEEIQPIEDNENE